MLVGEMSVFFHRSCRGQRSQ